MERIVALAERNDFDSLKSYEFIRVGQYREVSWS